MNQFFRSFMYALNGIRVSWREQRNLKIQSAIALLTAVAGFYFRITPTEWCLVLFAMALVMVIEMVNSAIEGLVDLVTRERNELAGKVKDIAAGAVLLAAVFALAIGVLVFGKYVIA